MDKCRWCKRTIGLDLLGICRPCREKTLLGPEGAKQARQQRRSERDLKSLGELMRRGK
jgi:hypothetical protein